MEDIHVIIELAKEYIKHNDCNKEGCREDLPNFIELCMKLTVPGYAKAIVDAYNQGILDTIKKDI